jgi:hypothetical protein
VCSDSAQRTGLRGQHRPAARAERRSAQRWGGHRFTPDFCENAKNTNVPLVHAARQPCACHLHGGMRTAIAHAAVQSPSHHCTPFARNRYISASSSRLSGTRRSTLTERGVSMCDVVSGREAGWERCRGREGVPGTTGERRGARGASVGRSENALCALFLCNFRNPQLISKKSSNFGVL